MITMDARMAALFEQDKNEQYNGGRNGAVPSNMRRKSTAILPIAQFFAEGTA
jgi:hypothetical protein